MENLGVLLVFLWVAYIIGRLAYRLVENKIIFYIAFLGFLVFPFWDLIMENGMNLDSYTVDVLAEQIVADVNYIYIKIKTLIGNLTA